MNTCNYEHWRPGTVVSVSTAGIWRHVGILTERSWNGYPTVISNSHRRDGVVEETWDDFRQGNTVRVDSYPGQLPSTEVVRRARQLIGRRWDLVVFNCEHFVRRAHGIREQSPQLQVAVIVSVVVIGLLLGSERAGGSGLSA